MLSFLVLPLLFPYTWTAVSPADHADDAEECSKLHYYAEKRQLPHSGDNAVHVYTIKLWGDMLSFLVLPLLFPYTWTAVSPADHAEDAEECSKLHYYAEKRQLPHSADNAVHVYATKLWENMLAHSLFIPCSFLALPLCVNGLFSRRSRWLRRGMQQAALFRREKTVAT